MASMHATMGGAGASGAGGKGSYSGSAKGGVAVEEELLRTTLADLEAGHGGSVYVATAAPEVRLGFLRKVFGILAVQLAATALICGLFMMFPPARSAALAAPGLLSTLSIVGAIGVLFGLTACKDSYPLNMQLLAAFTVLESLSVGVVCAAYAAAGLGYLVLEALVLTLAIFSGITLYCIVSKKDFSFMGAGLMGALLALLGASFVNIIIGFTGGKSAFLAFIISWGGATLFSLFILYDVSRLILHMSPDDYVLAAVTLYLDILNLFLYILSILSRDRD